MGDLADDPASGHREGFAEVGDPSIRWPVLSTLDLDDLLEELRSRASTARQSQERLRSLLEAVVAVSSNLDLPEVLHRIVLAACELVDARYGALGVLGPGGEELVEFVTHGITEDERAAIGPLPRGHGLLGLIITSPRPQRVARISEHPQSYGFPPGHPPMTSFLGTPVRIRDHVFGNLYLTDKRGRPEFTDEDEAFLVALAAAAGIAIENARLYETTRTQQRWGEVVAAATHSLLAGSSVPDVVEDTAARVLELTGATTCAAALVRESDLVVVAAHGHALPGAAEIGAVIDDPRWRSSLAERAPVEFDAQGLRIVLLPLQFGSAPLGALAVGWATDVDHAALLGPLVDFGQRMAVALTAATAQRERARSEVFEDRDRIARDMHDHVIQRLFATGLSLQSAARMTNNDISARLDAAVDELDAAIKDIRSTIFALHRTGDSPGIEAAISRLCADSSVSLGFAPNLRFTGPVHEIPDTHVLDVLAVVREALSNVARHAHATSVDVDVALDEQLRVTVLDDGQGLPQNAPRSGLDNLRRRAEDRQGTFVIDTDSEGTRLSWTVPVRPLLM